MSIQGSEEELHCAAGASDAEPEGDAVELEVLHAEKAAALEQLLRLLRLDPERHAGAAGARQGFLGLGA